MNVHLIIAQKNILSTKIFSNFFIILDLSHPFLMESFKLLPEIIHLLTDLFQWSLIIDDEISIARLFFTGSWDWSWLVA